MNITLPRDVEYIISSLEAAGYRADIVGGSVRDFLLGKTPGDYDITTSALPDEVKEVFSTERTIDTGIKHGTVTLILDSVSYEITTYRFDGEYDDSRHPSSVSFTRRIEDDLMRRDFTVNAMAYSTRHGLTDLYGGRQDIDARLIRAVGDADTRFGEDALRILRALRFAATLGFDIEENTADAVIRNAYRLSKVSAERIYIEWRKLLFGASAYRIIRDFSSVIVEIIPELSSLKLPDESRFEKVSYLPRMLSLFALSCEDSASSFESAMRRLRVDNATRIMGMTVLSSLGKFDLKTDKGIVYALKEIGELAVRELIELEMLLGYDARSASERLDAILSAGTPYRISDLKINGNDLLAIGAQGREIGDILNLLLDEVIEGRIQNEPDELTAAAKQRLGG